MKQTQNNKSQIISQFIDELQWNRFGFYYYEDLCFHCSMKENPKESFDYWKSKGIKNTDQVYEYVISDMKK